MPFRFVVKYLRKYGATIGDNCRFERGINIHRPIGKRPFENLIIGKEVYLGHNILIDLTCKVEIKKKVSIGARCQLWTHAGYYAAKDMINPEYREQFGDVIINECTIIYSNVVIGHGVTIGNFARIGANSLVNKNVDDYAFVGGVPMKAIQKI